TSKIRAFIGPERYNTLPGGILALDVNNGEHYWVARKIEIRDLTAEEKIERPIQGKNSKKVTYEQYLTVQQEREKKVKALNGGR
ncbi:MAG TPA: GLPGLI family protein, partial [Cyclobacteriaceae bacterium]|nr:GLPGLI family protein [Cyclobacteriaceae bacterium]